MTGVVVTGLGWVGAHGCGREALARALREGVARTSPVEPWGDRPRSRPRRAATAALVDLTELAPWLPAGMARRRSPPSRLAVAAARMALADAGLPPDDADGDGPTATVLATAFGPSSHTEKFYRQVLTEGPEAASPALFTECVANAPAAQIAICCRATGPNLTVSQREAGPLVAVARGAAEILAGRAGRALVGCVDEMSPLLHDVLDRLGALADRARPLERRRAGFLAAEGATVLVLEREDAAAARGAPVRARIAGWARGFDPSATRLGWGGDAAGLAGTLASALRDAGVDLTTIDRIVSGASGSRVGDRAEARVVRSALPDPPPVLAPKGALGEFGGGQLAAAALAAEGETPWAAPWFEEPDPELGIRPADPSSLRPARRVLVSAVAAGGAAAWLVLDRGAAA